MIITITASTMISSSGHPTSKVSSPTLASSTGGGIPSEVETEPGELSTARATTSSFEVKTKGKIKPNKMIIYGRFDSL